MGEGQASNQRFVPLHVVVARMVHEAILGKNVSLLSRLRTMLLGSTLTTEESGCIQSALETAMSEVDKVDDLGSAILGYIDEIKQHCLNGRTAERGGDTPS